MARALTWLATLCLAACASGGGTSGKSSSLDLGSMMAPVPASTPNVVTQAEFGARENPVRVVDPEGERDYLSRLRCGNGGPPQFSRIGSMAQVGPYGKILDSYRVQCSGEPERTVFMDMYHCAQDVRVIPGFDLLPEMGSPRTQDGCATK